MSKSKKGIPSTMKGKKHTKESKRNMSEAHRGLKQSEETKRKRGIAMLGNKYSLGFKQSEETKRKRCESRKWYKHSEETKRKIKEKLLGIQRSEETKRKMSIAGKNLSDEQRNKCRLNNLGEKCNFWKGGLTQKNKLRLSVVNWKRIANQIRERDNYACQHCGVTSIMLDVHHITPYYLTQNDSPENLITLCRKCHMIEEQKFIQSISFLQSLAIVVLNSS